VPVGVDEFGEAEVLAVERGGKLTVRDCQREWSSGIPQFRNSVAADGAVGVDRRRAGG
jgi:hypothetical protein